MEADRPPRRLGRARERKARVGEQRLERRALLGAGHVLEPREVVGVITVLDMNAAERTMLTRFRRWFDQYDKEWFKIPHGFEKLVRDLFFQPLQDKLEG